MKIIIKIIRVKDFILNIYNVLRFIRILAVEKISLIAMTNKILYREFIYTLYANNLSSKDRLLILIHCFGFINKIFDIKIINDLKDSKNYILLSDDLTNTYKITLSIVSHTAEGIFRLKYLYKDKYLFEFGFLIAPGKLFNILDKDVILICKMQLVKGNTVLYRDALSENARSTPQRQLFYAIIGIAKKMNINTIISVDAQNQISYEKDISSFHSTYNVFMETFEGVERVNKFYFLKLPYTEKPTKSSHGRGKREKREFNRQITIAACLSLDDLVSI